MAGIPRQRGPQDGPEHGDGFLPPSVVARELEAMVPGLRVTPRQMHAWADRRHRNGFPEPKRRGSWWGRDDVPFYDPQEVYDWWLGYEPSKGGPAFHRSAAG